MMKLIFLTLFVCGAGLAVAALMMCFSPDKPEKIKPTPAPKWFEKHPVKI